MRGAEGSAHAASPVASLLGATQLFHHLAAEQLRELAGRARQRRYRQGEVVFYQGDPAAYLVVLASGALKLRVTSESGGQLILGLVYRPAAVIGEVALLDGGPHEATCEALEPSEVLLIPRDDLLTQLKTSAEVAEGLLLTMAARVRQSVEQSSDLALLNVQGRLAKVLLGLAQDQGDGSRQAIPLTLTQSALAEMVGGSRVSVNRALGALEHRGVLKIDRGRITLLEPQHLERLVR